jgi:hypothetical protein
MLSRMSKRATGGNHRDIPTDALYSDAAAAKDELRQNSIGTSVASTVTFLAGVWLIISPFALDYPDTDVGFAGYRNDVLVGAVIGALALVRAATPHDLPWFSVVNAALGGWLIAAPQVLAYAEAADASNATANDVIVGVVVLVVAAASAAFTYRERAHVRTEAWRNGRRSAHAAEQ